MATIDEIMAKYKTVEPSVAEPQADRSVEDIMAKYATTAPITVDDVVDDTAPSGDIESIMQKYQPQDDTAMASGGIEATMPDNDQIRQLNERNAPRTDLLVKQPEPPHTPPPAPLTPAGGGVPPLQVDTTGQDRKSVV